MNTISVFEPHQADTQSLIALNLAIALQNQTGEKVLIVDFSFDETDSLSFMLGETSTAEVIEFSSCFKFHNCGVHVLPFSGVRDLMAGHRHGNISGLMSDINGYFSWCVVTSETGLTERVVELFDISGMVLLVVTPHILGLRQAKCCYEYLQGKHFPMQKLEVLVKVPETRACLSDRDVEKYLGHNIFGKIPASHHTVFSALNSAMPPMLASPHSPFSYAVKEIAFNVLKNKHRFVLNEKKEEPSRQEIARAPQSIREIKQRIKRRLLEEFDLRKMDTGPVTDVGKQSEVKMSALKKIEELVARECESIADRADRSRLVQVLLDETVGLGPLEGLLRDPDITEIMVNGKDKIFIEKKGKIHRTDVRFDSDNDVRIVTDRILAPVGRRVDESSPLVDARLADGSRVNIIIPPLSLAGPCITIRKFITDRLSPEDMVKSGSLNQNMLEFLKVCVRIKKNIIISGGTGSGKTTLLNILSSFIPDDERIITIEDSAELKLQQEHVVPLESRPASIEGRGDVPIRRLVVNALRMRPDRIIVGECRGAEAIDMLQAMNTGHEGSLTTIHANTPQDAILRLATMVLWSGTELPDKAIKDQISAAIDVVVQTQRMFDGSRKITRISELSRHGDEIKTNDIFSYRQEGISESGNVSGAFEPTGYVPSFYEEIKQYGLELDKNIFSK
ncbi:MAG: ATPase, T2SS/T4P/T4SS family [Elusimicrobiota bacterium]